MDDKKISLSDFVATIKLNGIDKIKEDLKEVENNLDRILGKCERLAELERQIQAQPLKFVPKDSNGIRI